MAGSAAQQRYLWRRARQMGLDVSVLKANAAFEGLSGGIGDGGHAFGPFQMNDAGGVLTGKLPAHWSAQQKNNWAWSKQGIDYALRGIKSVMGNKRGAAAMKALVFRYERPANMQQKYLERLEAWKTGKYGSTPAGRAGFGQSVAKGPRRETRFDQEVFGKQAAALFIEASAAAAAGDLRPQAELAGSLQQARKAATVTSLTRPQGGRGGSARGPGGSGGGLGAQALRQAEKQLGQWYVWGGESRAEGGFDCSGLIQWAYKAAGVNIPRVAADQIKAARKIKWNQLRPGDVLAARDGSHIVMYAGGGRVIAAPSRGKKVQYQPLSYFKTQNYRPGRIGRG